MRARLQFGSALCELRLDESRVLSELDLSRVLCEALVKWEILGVRDCVKLKSELRVDRALMLK